MARPYSDDSALTTHTVLKKDIPWETCALIRSRCPRYFEHASSSAPLLSDFCDCRRYMTARLLGDKDLHIIRAYDKRPPAVQEQQLEDVCTQPLPRPSHPSLNLACNPPPVQPERRAAAPQRGFDEMHNGAARDDDLALGTSSMHDSACWRC